MAFSSGGGVVGGTEALADGAGADSLTEAEGAALVPASLVERQPKSKTGSNESAARL
ncbi:MAG: hypothetical protein IPI67_10845 [Myxococcales bacterium]|nr:hypothetical protein [Myxococcales bacterium]